MTETEETRVDRGQVDSVMPLVIIGWFGSLAVGLYGWWKTGQVDHMFPWVGITVPAGLLLAGSWVRQKRGGSSA